MEEISTNKREMWSNRWLFVLAAAGSAVGLGNIWKFSYIAGENGGGAFVLIYLACIALVGVPIMMAEILIAVLVERALLPPCRNCPSRHPPRGMKLVGWLGVIAGFLILSYYVVIAWVGPQLSGFRALGRSLALVLKEQKLYLTIFSVVLGSFCFGTRYL